MKKYSNSLTLRIFLLTFCFTMLACAVTYAAIAYLTPITHTALLEEELDQQADALVNRLEGRTAEECRDILTGFVRENDVELCLTDDSGVIWYNTRAYIAEDQGVASQSGDMSPLLAAQEENSALSLVEDVVITDHSASGGYGRTYSFSYADGTPAQLEILSAMRAVNQATEAMRKLLPYLVLMALALSLLGALLYYHSITRPIVSISRIAGKMAAQDFGVRWTQRRSDEIGLLGDSLNLLSENLSGALTQLKEANAALQKDIDRERELERQRTAFFAAASHELKTPVTILKGQLSGMLAQVGVYQDREKYLARALQVTARMEGLIREILTISRIESSSYKLQKSPVNLSGLIGKLLEQSEELIAQKDMRVVQDVQPDVIVSGSESLLNNALDNVLMNAVLYSPQGASIRVTLDGTRLSVENTQASIPEDALAHLFEPFYRVEPSRSRASGGSGLGLYLVRCILNLHGIVCRMENISDGVRFSADLA